MALLPLTAGAVARALPLHTLLDLVAEPHDLENDFHVLLDYLQPYYGTLPPAEPLPRVRSAAKRCLKDPGVHGDFVRLLLNTIRGQFAVHFGQLCVHALLREIAPQVAALREYYARKAAVLHLSEPAAELLERGVHGFYMQYLQSPRLLAQLESLATEALGSEDVATALGLPLRAGPPSSPISILKLLSSIGMAEIIQDMVVRVATQRVLAYVQGLCQGLWDVSLMGQIQSWVHASVAPVFELACSAHGSFSSDLLLIARDELILLRIGEIYAMVGAYPRLAAALSELHACLVLAQKTEHRDRLVEYFVRHCQRFLLNSASNTVDIILVYTKTLKAFLAVDPTGVLLDKVARPIRRYLKSRPDLVSQLVGAMLDKNPCTNRLVEVANALVSPSQDTPVVDDLSDIDWMPDPIDALPDFKKRKVLDVVQALTSIVHLTSVFVDEFTRLFGDRLLQSEKYDPQSILQYVDLLKARFGTGEFATLDVMIRDIDESTKMNQQIGCRSLFSLAVLSKMYWPSVHENLSENDYFPIPVEADFAEYSDKYKQLKKGRDIRLIPSLGLVKLDIFILDTCKEYTVTPAQAKVIEIFDDDMDSMRLETIAMACAMPSYVTSQALRFWVHEGILLLENGQYKAAA